MGGKGGDPPAPPNYAPIAQGQIESAQLAAAVAREQLDWAKATYARDREVTDRVIDRAFRVQDDESAAARADRARVQERFQPAEDRLLAEAASYDSQGRQEVEAGRAAATVSSQMDAARQGAIADLENYGIDPSQTRSAAMDLSLRVAQGAAAAGAANAGREQAINAGRALRSEAINVGRGYGSQIAQSYGTALAAGNQAINAGLATTQVGAQTMGTGAQWNQIAGQSQLGQADLLTRDYNNQMQAYQAQRQNAGGIGKGIGTIVGGIAGAYFGGPFGAAAGATAGGGLGSAIDGYKEGGVVRPNAQAQAIRAANAQGGQVQAIPASMSPSGGAETDDVPIIANQGELVVPEDVVAWKGEEFFHKLAISSREHMGEKNPRGLGNRPNMKAIQAQQGARARA